MMTVWLGAGLLIFGAVGVGTCICRERREHTGQLKNLEQAFLIISGEIGYSRISLPEILKDTGEKIAPKDPVGNAFLQIAARLCDGSGQDIRDIWQEEMEKVLGMSRLTAQEKELICSFPDTVWYLDGERQQSAVRKFAQRIGEAAMCAAQKEQEENRVTMMVSLACGIFTALMLC
ncbi:MAG: stage III sporulation protein AB [Lachnospiraceae bacterium]|nr:stage III sporulation protein AB [Lachnospiraceae bacterium]